jgi:hypothetical protein
MNDWFQFSSLTIKERHLGLFLGKLGVPYIDKFGARKCVGVCPHIWTWFSATAAQSSRWGISVK